MQSSKSDPLSPIQKLTDNIPKDKIPAHVAVIMDGNGRWARKKNLPRVMGHKKGAETVRTVVKSCVQTGIKHLTLYAFSTENWKRPEAEVNFLMGLLDQFLESEIDKLVKEGIRFHTIGDTEALPDSVQKKISVMKERTLSNTTLHLIVALNYGSRQEIVRSVRRWMQTGKPGEPDHLITENDITGHLDTAGFPDPDLLIRTSGEMRLSNFLLWQCSYSELYVSPKLWPDFSEKDFADAIESYVMRDRRYGGV